MNRAERKKYEALKTHEEKEAFDEGYVMGERHALMRAELWLRQKSRKSRDYPGDDIAHAKGRAAAYHNAAEQMKVLSQKEG